MSESSSWIESNAEDSAPRNNSKLDKEGASILIVDDNTFNVFSLQLLIEDTFKMPCDTAHSGKEAL